MSRLIALLHDASQKRLVFLMHEPGHAHQARQVVDNRIGSVSSCNRPLRVCEAVKREVLLNKPLHVGPSFATRDEHVWRQSGQVEL